MKNRKCKVCNTNLISFLEEHMVRNHKAYGNQTKSCLVEHMLMKHQANEHHIILIDTIYVNLIQPWVFVQNNDKKRF